jgi:serine phosphatase RsbU (regulator of sigma subunit)
VAELVLYTDGFADQLSPSGERFGNNRIVSLIKNTNSGSADANLINLTKDVDTWQADAHQNDDQLAVWMQLKHHTKPVVG